MAGTEVRIGEGLLAELRTGRRRTPLRCSTGRGGAPRRLLANASIATNSPREAAKTFTVLEAVLRPWCSRLRPWFRLLAAAAAASRLAACRVAVPARIELWQVRPRCWR